MKNYLIIIALLICNLGFSQDYLSNNPEWVELKSSCSSVGLDIICVSEKYKITLSGDTSINNIAYHKTRRLGTKTTRNLLTDEIISEELIDDYLFPLREAQQKFYIYDADTDEDQLLHNFNLEVGDAAVAADGCSVTQTITDIELLSFGTQMRNKYSIFSSTAIGMTSLYEGIGSSRGLFIRPCTDMVAIEGGTKILCYTSDTETIVLDSFSNCETPIPVDTKQLVVQEANIYPNPFDDKIVIDNLFSNSNDEIEIELFDVQGKLIKSISDIENEEQIEILTSGINSGIYILLISSKDKVQSTKLIKL